VGQAGVFTFADPSMLCQLWFRLSHYHEFGRSQSWFLRVVETPHNRILECRPTATVIVIGVESAAPEGITKPSRTLITTAVVALTTFVRRVAMTAESMDATVRAHVMEKFKNERNGRLVSDFSSGSAAESALLTAHYGGWGRLLQSQSPSSR